jgi:hypothetical protein
MCFEGRACGESVKATMPRLDWKGHRAPAKWVWVRANPGDFTPQANQFPAI